MKQWLEAFVKEGDAHIQSQMRNQRIGLVAADMIQQSRRSRGGMVVADQILQWCRHRGVLVADHLQKRCMMLS